jgi:hypothetical protein
MDVLGLHIWQWAVLIIEAEAGKEAEKLTDAWVQVKLQIGDLIKHFICPQLAIVLKKVIGPMLGNEVVGCIVTKQLV